MPVLPDTAALEAGRLCVGGVALSELAAAHGTPLHVYDEATLRNRARAYRDALDGYPGAARAVYACKANATVGLLRILLDEGMGMDVASEGELAHALAAGAPGAQLVVHGNNKSDADIRAAVAAEAGLLVVDHVEELDQVERIAAAAGREQPILLRVTPGIEAATHAKIRTAHASSKFGIAPGDIARAADRAAACPHLRLDGLHVHLGSQIRDLDTYVQAVEWLAGSPRPPVSPCSTSAEGSRSRTPTTTTRPTCGPPPRPPPRRSPSGSTPGPSSCSSPAAPWLGRAASRSTRSGP